MCFSCWAADFLGCPMCLMVTKFFVSRVRKRTTKKNCQRTMQSCHLFLSNVVEIHTKYGSPRSGGPDAINVVVVCRCVCLSVCLWPFSWAKLGAFPAFSFWIMLRLGLEGCKHESFWRSASANVVRGGTFHWYENSNFSHEVCGSLSCFHTSDESIDAM